MTIQSCGDWTAEIGKLKAGDMAHLQGPFGRFSHLVAPLQSELIMIAGGVGITPMIGMLRYLQDQNDRRPITLIWSNRTKQRLFYENELVDMTKQLTSFRWIPIFSRETNTDVLSGRLDKQRLDDLLKHCSRQATVFICGPPEMIASVRYQLRQIGFRSSEIKHEAFSL